MCKFRTREWPTSVPQEENAKRRKARRMKLLREKVLYMAKELRQSGKSSETVQFPGTGAESGEVNASASLCDSGLATVAMIAECSTPLTA